ncbi:hypothetical protein, partial [Falsiroseomonas oryzae]|uniref:hypothetical protein n=1 Tax=Falsiroseomonas oryzae TaxID=2766473 RepID=UPI0022EB6407
GDVYRGYLVDDSARYDPNQTIALGTGVYWIASEQQIGGPAQSARGTVWTDAYLDAQSGQWLQPRSWWNWGVPSGTAGLGSEYDAVWDGREWDDFGRAGQHLSNFQRDSLYTWFFADGATGDVYRGYLVDDSARYDPNQTIALGTGVYWIASEQQIGGPAQSARGTVWTDAYLDAQSGQWLQPRSWWSWGVPSGTAGLGSEYDAVWDGREWDDFGRAGQHLADLL